MQNLDTGSILAIITGVISIASVITAITPTPKDDKVIGKIYKVIELLGLNVFRAKDKG